LVNTFLYASGIAILYKFYKNMMQTIALFDICARIELYYYENDYMFSGGSYESSSNLSST
ncbi:MAG: hypothetical protein L0H90_00630, partial [Lactococcus sp.]|nr:hypothetical protein [Lactococcus sp.]